MAPAFPLTRLDLEIIVGLLGIICTLGAVLYRRDYGNFRERLKEHDERFGKQDVKIDQLEEDRTEQRGDIRYIKETMAEIREYIYNGRRQT